MASRKFAISMPEEVMEQVTRAAEERGVTRSRFIAEILRRTVRARSDAEITRRINRLFADPELVAEQVETADRFHSVAPPEGSEW